MFTSPYQVSIVVGIVESQAFWNVLYFINCMSINEEVIIIIIIRDLSFLNWYLTRIMVISARLMLCIEYFSHPYKRLPKRRAINRHDHYWPLVIIVVQCSRPNITFFHYRCHYLWVKICSSSTHNNAWFETNIPTQ